MCGSGSTSGGLPALVAITAAEYRALEVRLVGTLILGVAALSVLVALIFTAAWILKTRGYWDADADA